MSNETPESVYIARFNVRPSREQFESACRRLELHLADLKRIKLDGFGPEALGAEFIRYQAAFQRYETFSRREVSGFMREWWRIDPIEDVDRVRRRANRQRNLAIDQLHAIRAALLARGPEGLAALKTLFLTGEPHLVMWSFESVVEHFPDDAEPILEAMLALPENDYRVDLTRRWEYRDALQMIRGYRARRAGALAPTLADETEVGLAPALSTLDRSPAEFPGLLFERFAEHVFTGEMAFHAAINAAWKQVVTDQRLDPKYHDHAELAEFDPKYRRELATVVADYYGNGIYAQHLSEHRFDYWQEDGSPVPFEALQEALYHVVRHDSATPYQPAATWKPSAS